MSVSSKFENFCNAILINDSTVGNIQYRYGRVTRQLNEDFWGTTSSTSHSLYVGSYGRDTEIHVSDVDILMQLPYSQFELYNGYQTNGQSALLQAVRNSIQKTYKSSIKGDGQVVVVSWTDGVVFEILPCFINDDGESYTYPDTNNGGSWKTTNPVPERKAIKAANDAYNKNLKRLCRMARVWKDKWSVPIGGLLIDTLAYDFMSTWEWRYKSYTYYDWMIRDFFLYLKTRSTSQDYWLAPGSHHRVYRKGNFGYKASQCYNIAIEAVRYEKDEMPYSANLKWKEIFGNIFVG